jgi:hypothetical protein
LVDAAAEFLPEEWESAEPIPYSAGFYADIQCPGDQESFYVLSGNSNSGYMNNFSRYDAISDTWEILDDFPIGAWGVAATCYEGKIYAAGGAHPPTTYSTLYIYSITSDTWITGAVLPRDANAATLGAWEGYLYLIGGDDAPATPLSPETQVDRYDIGADEWEAEWGTAMPEATLATGVQVGPFVFMIGGYTANPVNSDAALRYNMADDSWSEGPAFTSRRAALGLAPTELYLYAIGGDATGGGSWNATAMVQRLDWTTWPNGTWETIDSLPQAVLGNTAGACTQANTGGEVWSAGGSNASHIFTSTNLYLAAEPCYTLSYSLAVSPDTMEGAALPGRSVSYNLTISNTGSASDSYTVTVSADWSVSAFATIGPVDPYHSSDLVVTVTVPISAADGEMDVATVTVTSFAEPSMSAGATLTSTAVLKEVYLPFIVNG